jgi:hypothetical protein
LPAGVSYNASSNQISGTATTAGIYSVNVTVNDGHGGTDFDSYFWNVYPDPTTSGSTGGGTSMGISSSGTPYAEVYFGSPYLNANNATGNTLALQYTAVPLYATVVMFNPGNPTASVPVTLMITPNGRSLLNTTTVSLTNGQSKTVIVTAQGISQLPQDVVIRAFVNGLETSRDTMTNVGVVLPHDVNAEDTPQGMKDRISLGTGNWGSYYGTVIVAPNLMGTQNIGLTIQRPTNDDKWGNATVDATDLARLSRVTEGYVKIVGTVQTAPSLGADGQPDGLGQNANQLHLEAVIPQLGGDAFLVQKKGDSTEAIPVEVAKSTFVPLNGVYTKITVVDPTTKKSVEKEGYVWGVDVPTAYLSDSGNPSNIDQLEVKEYIDRPTDKQVGSGSLFQKAESGWLSPTDAKMDRLAVGAFYPLNEYTKTQLKKLCALDIINTIGKDSPDAPGKAYATQYRAFRVKGGAEAVIKKSGFSITADMNAKVVGDSVRYSITITVAPMAVKTAQPGVLKDVKAVEIPIEDK